MGWKYICSDFWFAHTDLKFPALEYQRLSDDDKSVVNSMFETLCKILRIANEGTKSCALHGLGHVHHPGVSEVVQAFIDDLPEEARSSEAIHWLEQCRDGSVM